MALDWNTITLYGQSAHSSRLGKIASGLAKPVMGIISLLPPLYFGSPQSFLLSAPILTGVAIRERSFNKHLTKEFNEAFGKGHDKLYIAKKPTFNMPPSKPEHIAAADTIKRAHIKSLAGFFLKPLFGTAVFYACFKAADTLHNAFIKITGFEPQPSQPQPPYTPETDPMILWMDKNETAVMAGLAATAFATVATVSYGCSNVLKHIETAYRFHKVVKGDWIITDEPPKELSSSKISLEKVFGIFAPQPGAARIIEPQAPVIANTLNL